ncbi:MAG TPA: HEAT repeat domain-containing protein [Thermoanaerobaculia bacterium]|nr:HEAT repeat domain-containing protein [Thermoanaerobaculia bacterium]
MWELGILLAVAAGGMAKAVYETNISLRHRISEMESYGLTVEKVSTIGFLLDEELHAGDGVVRITWRKTSRKNGRFRLRIAIPGLAGFDISIRPESPVLKWTPEIALGAPELDDAFSVQGPDRVVSALLDAEARRLMLAIDNGSRSLRLQYGEVEAEIKETELVRLLPQMLDLGHRFAGLGDIRQKLAENARQDPEPGVRLHNLLLLVHESPEAADSREALRQACLDPSPRVRLGAALELGSEARNTLLELAEETEDDGISAQAIARLSGELTVQQARDLLLAALRRRHLETARSCLTALAASGTAEAVEALVEVLDRESGDLAIAAAEALGAAGNPAAEPALIRALERPAANLQAAAARALGRVGTAAAVLPLKEAREGSLSINLLRATRQAIAEIQSRLPAASAGQLSIAETEAGQLSFASDPGGQLSMPPPEAHRNLPRQRS